MFEILKEENVRLIMTSIELVSIALYIILGMIESRQGCAIGISRTKQILAYISSVLEALQIAFAKNSTWVFVKAGVSLLWCITSYVELLTVRDLKMEAEAFNIEITEEMQNQFFKEYGEYINLEEVDEEQIQKLTEFFNKHREYFEGNNDKGGEE